MADFYSLIVKAVATLGPDSSSESRQVLYDRVRAALSDELRITDPPFTKFEIAREESAFDDALSRVEAEAAQRDVLDITSVDMDADADLETEVASRKMVVSGVAIGRLDPIWRFAFRSQPLPSRR